MANQPPALSSHAVVITDDRGQRHVVMHDSKKGTLNKAVANYLAQFYPFRKVEKSRTIVLGTCPAPSGK